MTGGSRGSCCVNLKNHRQRLQVSVTMALGVDDIVMMNESTEDPDFFKCASFDVPKVNEPTQALVRLSITGKGVNIREQRTISIQKPQDNCMPFFDKPIYTPGELMNCRILLIDNELKPMEMTVPRVYVEDPSGFQIAEWKDQFSGNGTISISVLTDSEAMPGYYNIYMKRDTSKYPEYCGNFQLKEYVTPRIMVNLEAPDTVSVLDSQLVVTVSAHYLTGDATPGNVSIKLCRYRNYYYEPKSNCFERDPVCKEDTGAVGPDGTYTTAFNLKDFSINGEGFQNNLQMELMFVEEGTGTLMTDYKNVYIATALASLQLQYQYMDDFYKCGLDYYITALLKDEKETPIPGAAIEVTVNDVLITTLKTDSKGEIEYYLITINYTDPVLDITVAYKNPKQCFFMQYSDEQYPIGRIQVYRTYSKTMSFVEIQRPRVDLLCEKTCSIVVRYVLSKDCDREMASHQSFYFQVQSKLNTVHYSTHVVNIPPRSGSFQVNLDVKSEWPPRIDLLVKAFVGGEIIAHTIPVNIEKCFRNKVSMGFSTDIAMPGSNINLTLSGAPFSLCGCRVYDKALTLLNPYDPFNADTVYGFMYMMTQFGFYVDGINYADPPPPCKSPYKQIFCNGAFYVQVSNATDGDSYQCFERLGMVIVASDALRKPEVCRSPEPVPPPELFTRDVMSLQSLAAKASGAPAPGPPETISTVRLNANNSFGYRMVYLSNTSTTITETLPDTLTMWMGNTYCLSKEKGFGMTTKPANVTTWLPFYCTLTCVPSFYKGEIMILTVALSNNLGHCTKVRVLLHSSKDYNAVSADNLTEERTVQDGRQTYYRFNITANSIGKINLTMSCWTTFHGKSCDGPDDPLIARRNDTVLKPVTVMAPGIPYDDTTTHLICVNNSIVEKNFSVNIPVNMVEGTARASISCMIDFLSLSCENIGNLLVAPSGCCDQIQECQCSIATLLEHLETTKQLDEKRRQEGTMLLALGLQRMRRCMDMGAYGSFWGSGDYTNTWITIRGLNTIGKCRKFIYVPESMAEQNLNWLSRNQDASTGCFKVIGPCYSLQEGTDPEVALTMQFVLMHLRANYTLGAAMLPKAMSCIESARTKGKLDMYLKAYLLLISALSNDWSTWETLYAEIKGPFEKVGDFFYWDAADIGCGPTRSCSSSYLQILSCTLHATLLHPTMSDDKMTFCTELTISMIRLTNSKGGYISMMDTSTALEALTVFASKKSVPNSQHTVTVYAGTKVIANRMLDAQDRLLLRRDNLPHIPADYTLRVEGEGCMVAQVTMKCNIAVPEKNTAFSLSARTSSKSCTYGTTKMFDLQLNVSFHGIASTCNMVMIRIIPMTSYTVYSASAYKLQDPDVQSDVISKTETTNLGYIIYINDVAKLPAMFILKYTAENMVFKVLGGNVYASCYNDEALNGYTKYQHPCDSAK